MRTITRDFFSEVFDEAILDYTRNRFISPEECDELKAAITLRLNEKLEDEILDNAKIILTFSGI
jgi:hypothetical protein